MLLDLGQVSVKEICSKCCSLHSPAARHPCAAGAPSTAGPAAPSEGEPGEGDPVPHSQVPVTLPLRPGGGNRAVCQQPRSTQCSPGEASLTVSWRGPGLPPAPGRGWFRGFSAVSCNASTLELASLLGVWEGERQVGKAEVFAGCPEDFSPIGQTDVPSHCR